MNRLENFAGKSLSTPALAPALASSLSVALAMAVVLPGTAVAQTQAPSAAQAGPPANRASMLEGSALEGDWALVGFGVGVSPSYDGSDNYSGLAVPFAMGSYGGVDFSPRGAGIALDFVKDADEGVYFDAGFTVALRSDRASGIKDEVVERLGKLDRAVEVGPTVGIGYAGVLHGYDSLSFTLDATWDVAGAHKGMVIKPSLSYFTPLSRSAIAVLSLNAEYTDAKFRDYYFAVSPAQSLVSGLRPYDPQGGGFNKAGATLVLGRDLDGDITNGGFVVGLIGNHSRMLGEAKNAPIVKGRGSKGQWFGGLGVGYLF